MTGEGELGGVFLTVDGRTDCGEEGGEEEVAADEVEDEAMRISKRGRLSAAVRAWVMSSGRAGVVPWS